MQYLYFIRTMTGEGPYDDIENIIEIISNGIDDTPLSVDMGEGDMIERKKLEGWINIDEDVYMEANGVLNANRVSNQKGLLLKTDVKITRYIEEKALVDAGELSETYMSASEYLALSKERNDIRIKIAEIRETNRVKNEFRMATWPE